MKRLLVLALACVVLTACGLGESASLPADPNEAAIARSAAIHRLAHGARIVRYHVEYETTCSIDITVDLSHRVDIDDDIPVTNAPLLPACTRPTERLVWHLTAHGVQAIFVALDRRTHRIIYIRPTWDAPGASRVEQHWVGRTAPFPPGGD